MNWPPAFLAVVGTSKVLAPQLAERRDIFDLRVLGERTVRDTISRAPVVTYDSSSLRAAADHMVLHDIGRLPVVPRRTPPQVIGILTRRDLLAAHKGRLKEARRAG